MAKWEIRRALRYGSQSLGFVDDLNAAKVQAISDIVANGNEGRIELIDQEKHILYYDIFPELS